MNETRKRKSIKLRSCQQQAAVKSCWVIKLKGFTVSWMYVCFFQWKDRGVLVLCLVLVFYCWRSLITLKSFQFTFRKPVLQHTVVIQPSVMSQTDLGRSDQTPSQVVTPPTHTAGFCVHLFPNLWKVKQQIDNKLFFGFLEIYKDVFWLFLLLFNCAVTLLYWSPACKNNPEINNKGPLNLRGSGLTLLFDRVVKSDLVTLLLWCCCQGDREALA